MSKIHKLKCVNPYFQKIKEGLKTFEFRYDDRFYKVGDFLELMEYHPLSKRFSGSTIYAEITYILSTYTGMEHGYIVMSIKVVATLPSE